MKQVALVLALAFGFASAAQAETLRWRQGPGGELLFWTLHTESGKPYVDHFRANPGELQERVYSRSYPTPEAAQAALALESQGASEGPLPEAFAPIESPRPFFQKIWTANKAWSAEWERKYAEWIQEEVTQDFFKTNNLATDCADAAFTLRWVFARMHGLPAASTLAGSRQLFTQDRGRREWDRLPTHADWRRDQRFRAALDYLMQNTYTHTLIKDTFPVAPSRDHLRAGTIYLHLFDWDSGHTEIVYRVADNINEPEPLRVIASDVPRAVRQLNEYGLQDWGDTPVQGKSGLVNFRWPERGARGWQLREPAKMPGYSEAQFAHDFLGNHDNFVTALIHRLYPNWQPDYQLAMRAKAQQVLERLRRRAEIVREGFAYCATHDCAEGTEGWENWSTPSRDAAIGRVIEGIDELDASRDCNSACRMELRSRLGDRITDVEGYSAITLRTALEVWRREAYSVDPRDSVARRWGL